MQEKRSSSIERKLETRKKIILGGLFTKAGLDNLDIDILYAMLLSSKEMLKVKPELMQIWKQFGQQQKYCENTKNI